MNEPQRLSIRDKYTNTHEVTTYFYPFKDKNPYHATLVHNGRTLRGKGSTELDSAQNVVSKVKYQ
jgi:hypothetical protein